MTDLIPYPWRQRWRPASFKGAQFHVEQESWASGRRVAMHEYPKRNTPYGEDMGKRAVRHNVEGYVIGPNYLDERDLLRAALDSDGPGQLVHHVLGNMLCLCDQYSITESRERGGFALFSMLFVQAGAVGDLNNGAPDSRGVVNRAASVAEAAASDALDTVLAQSTGGGGGGSPLATP